MASDAWGRTTASQQTDAASTVVTTEIPSAPGPTPYNRLGDWFAWLCLLLTATALAALTRKGELKH